jgi:hypothetical protein
MARKPEPTFDNDLMNMRTFGTGPTAPRTAAYVSDYTKDIAARMGKAFPETDKVNWDAVGRYLYCIGGHGLSVAQKLILAGVICETNPALADVILNQSLDRDCGRSSMPPMIYREGI